MPSLTLVAWTAIFALAGDLVWCAAGAHASEHVEPRPHAARRDPWDRYGWVMGAVWLVFLGFPLAGHRPRTSPCGLTGRWRSACVVAFAVTYVHGLVRIDTRTTPGAAATGTGRPATSSALIWH